jgi:hypothetical protein
VLDALSDDFDEIEESADVDVDVEVDVDDPESPFDDGVVDDVDDVDAELALPRLSVL